MARTGWSNPAIASFFSRNEFEGGGDEEASELVAPLRQAYREAAAVLASFSPQTLRPFGAEGGEGDAYEHLVDDCVRTFRSGSSGPQWTLKVEVRRDALTALAGRNALVSALEANPERPDTLVQQLFEQCLRGESLELEGRTSLELAACSQVADWLSGILKNVPSASEVEKRLDYISLLEPLEAMLKDGFAGRTPELDRMRNHVGIVDAESASGQVRRVFRTFLGRNRTVLVLWGVGGIGKSTLMAKFIVEHVRKAQFPYAYLDFDSGKIGVMRFATLLIQMLTQLGVQYPEQRPAIARFRRHYDRFLKLPESTTSPSGLEAGPDMLTEIERCTIRHFANIVRPMTITNESPPQEMPLLIVLDTFESLHEFSEARTRKIGAFARALEGLVPSLRVVISGRNDVTKLLAAEAFPVDSLELGDLDAAATDVILEHWGIADATQRASISGLAGGNPLALRLASQLSATGKLDTSLSSRVETMARRALGEGYIQGYFYDRILNHIQDPAVRQLAHPGLALRYLTAEIILEVLAGPCKLSIANLDEAKSLLERLQKYAQLVYPDGKGVRHRADVRRSVLTALDQDHPGVVSQINELAVAFHSGQTEPVSRGEEIYHRLRLNQPESIIESRWVTGVVEESLKGSGPELPVRAQLYLISKRVQADIEGTTRSLQRIELEMLNAEKAQDLLGHNLTSEARKLIMDTPRSPISPLALPLAQIEIQNKHWESAQPLLDEAQRAALNTGRTADLESALLLGAETAFRLGNHELSLKLAARAEEVLARSSRSDRLLWSLIFQARAAQNLNLPEAERAEISRRLEPQMASARLRDPSLAQQLLSYANSPIARGLLGLALRGVAGQLFELLVASLTKWAAERNVSLPPEMKTISRSFDPTKGISLLLQTFGRFVDDPTLISEIGKVLAAAGDVPIFGVQDASLNIS